MKKRIKQRENRKLKRFAGPKEIEFENKQLNSSGIKDSTAYKAIKR
jgi:hypothetical protein